MKRLLVILLLLAMCLSGLASCNKQKGGDKNSQTSQEGEAGNEASDAVIPLPEANPEWSGREFSIIYRDSYDYEWVFDETMAGSVINDSIYKRNKAVEDRYDITFAPISTPNVSFESDFLQPIQIAVSSGEDAYQLAAGMEYRLASVSAYGEFLNWYQIPNLDLTAAWWDGDFAETSAYNGSTYVMTGSLSLSHLYSSSCVFFNQDMVNSVIENGAETIYQKVWDGTWTLDAFYEYVQQFTADNGDDVWDATDTYGYATNVNTGVDAFIFCSEIPLSKRDADGEITLIPPTEKLINLANKLNLIINTSGNTFIQDAASKEIDPHIGMMLREKAVFTTSYLKKASELRETNINYGILPYPKWDEAQTEYHSITMDFSSAFAVPRSVEDQEFVGAVLEALAYYSYDYVRDALYSSVLKYRDAKDENSSKCIDIILENPQYDFAYIYAFSWGDQQGPSALLRTCIKAAKPYIANAYKSSETRFNTTLTEFLGNFK